LERHISMTVGRVVCQYSFRSFEGTNFSPLKRQLEQTQHKMRDVRDALGQAGMPSTLRQLECVEVKQLLDWHWRLQNCIKWRRVVDIQKIKTSSRLDSKQVSIVSCNPFNASAHLS
jgi:hypothetical protein